MLMIGFGVPRPQSVAQEHRSFAADSTCRCHLVLRRVVQVGRTDDTTAFLGATAVARDSRGRYFAAPILPHGAVAVFAPDGRFLMTMGRAGAGPGELGRVHHIRTTAGDSVLAYDQERLTLFDPNGTYVRAASPPPGARGFRFSLIDDRFVLINNYFPTHPSFILVDPARATAREFGRSIAGARFPDSDSLQFRIVDLGSGRFAAVQQNYSYQVEIWDTSGVMLRALSRDPEWFPRWSRQERLTRDPSTSQFAMVMDAYAERGGKRLWIAVRVPDKTWRPAPISMPAGQRGRAIRGPAPVPLASLSRAFDTVIEVLDVETGRVVMSHRFDPLLSGFMEGGLLYNRREDPSGISVIDVWRPEVQTERR
ncbi:MAG TPA: hypothetical protein VGA66_12925 [Mycobacterium sp.]